MNELIGITTNENGTAVVSSREVAEHFGKRHDNVIRDVDALKKDVLNFKEMFFETEMPDGYSRSQRAYLMNRDGFSLLAMSFTGKEALAWKLKYIEAFNQMERDWNSPEKIMARAIKIADRQIVQLQTVNAQLEQVVAECKPIIQYVDKILSSKGTLTITQIAADYGLSAYKLNNILHDEGIQRKVGDQWVLYNKHMNMGYTKSETIHFERLDGTPDTKLHTKWTQKGRLLIHNILEGRGIKANIDKALKTA